MIIRYLDFVFILLCPVSQVNYPKAPNRVLGLLGEGFGFGGEGLGPLQGSRSLRVMRVMFGNIWGLVVHPKKLKALYSTAKSCAARNPKP